MLPQVNEWSKDMWPLAGWLDEYLSGDGQIELAVTDLKRGGMVKIGHGLLAADAGHWSAAKRDMAFGFSRMLYSEMIDILASKGKGRFISSDLDISTRYMLGALSVGQPQLVKPFYKIVCDALDADYGLRDGRVPARDTTLRFAAFGLAIIGDWLGIPLDLDKHGLPRDPAWGQLVSNWRETTTDLLLRSLVAACDTHVERIAVTGREVDTQAAEFEFASVFEAVHPTEILAILRLRDLLNLPNPPIIDHPLMQTPYAAITCGPDEVTERDELLDRFLAVVRQRDPHVLPSGL